MRDFTGMLDGVMTVATAGGTFDMGDASGIAAHIVVSAISGTTPSATFVLEDSPDGTNWANVATSAAVTATGVTVLRSSGATTPIGRYVRVRMSAFTGTTPSITTATKARAM